jgi:acylphosphatase
MTARRVFYSGRVQGVGFRFSSKQTARGYDVCGWVKNLTDGRVELHVQAWELEEVEAFLDGIQESSLGSHIKEREIRVVASENGLRGFEIIR